MTGTLNRVLDEEIRLQVGPYEYQVLVPEFVRRNLQMRTGEELTLCISEYIEGNQNTSRMVPRRLGFLSEGELDFFDLLCTVDKIGAKKALKAMARPVREIANAIARHDAKWLTSLPGIGKGGADQIIATLKDKVVRYSVMPEREPGADGATTPAAAGEAAVIEDAYLALMSLGLSSIDARTKLDRAVAAGVPFKDVNDVLNLIFKAP